MDRHLEFSPEVYIDDWLMTDTWKINNWQRVNRYLDDRNIDGRYKSSQTI